MLIARLNREQAAGSLSSVALLAVSQLCTMRVELLGPLIGRVSPEPGRLDHRAVCAQAEAFNASVVLIEDKASGTQLIQELVELGLHAVTRYQPQADKVMRMHAQTAMIENGFVHLPREAGWRADFCTS